MSLWPCCVTGISAAEPRRRQRLFHNWLQSVITCRIHTYSHQSELLIDASWGHFWTIPMMCHVPFEQQIVTWNAMLKMIDGPNPMILLWWLISSLMFRNEFYFHASNHCVKEPHFFKSHFGTLALFVPLHHIQLSFSFFNEQRTHTETDESGIFTHIYLHLCSHRPGDILQADTDVSIMMSFYI